jgi:hypothetical protein
MKNQLFSCRMQEVPIALVPGAPIREGQLWSWSSQSENVCKTGRCTILCTYIFYCILVNVYNHACFTLWTCSIWITICKSNLRLCIYHKSILTVVSWELFFWLYNQRFFKLTRLSLWYRIYSHFKVYILKINAIFA